MDFDTDLQHLFDAISDSHEIGSGPYRHAADHQPTAPVPSPLTMLASTNNDTVAQLPIGMQNMSGDAHRGPPSAALTFSATPQSDISADISAAASSTCWETQTWVSTQPSSSSPQRVVDTSDPSPSTNVSRDFQWIQESPATARHDGPNTEKVERRKAAKRKRRVTEHRKTDDEIPVSCTAFLPSQPHHQRYSFSSRHRGRFLFPIPPGEPKVHFIP